MALFRMIAGSMIGLLAFAAVLGAAEPAVVREGSHWSGTFKGAGRISAGDRLQVRSAGDVTVSGCVCDEVVWTCKVQIKAPDERTAARRLAALAPVLSRQGPYHVLTVPPEAICAAPLQVKAPRDLAEVAVFSTYGRIEASEINSAIRAKTGGGAVKLDRIGRNVDIETTGGPIRLGTVNGDAHCLTGGGPITADMIRGAAVFQTGGGEITVREIGGLLRASTAGGPIRVGSAGGAVIASTAGGSIEVGQAQGTVTARSSAGPIKVGQAAGVECQSAAGTIRLDNVSHGLRAFSGMGSIVAQLMAGQPFADSFLSTRDGDITVLIPSNLGVRIRAENQSIESLRKIVSDFPGISVQIEGGLAVAEGVLNGGGPLLRINGSGGIISIKRRK